jgi:hypothetical protein
MFRQAIDIASGQHFSMHFQKNLSNKSLLCSRGVSMMNVVPLPPKMIHHSPNTESPQASFYSLTMEHNKTPLQNLIPAYRRVLYQANSHDSSPNLPTKTATKKEMVPILHTAMTK